LAFIIVLVVYITLNSNNKKINITFDYIGGTQVESIQLKKNSVLNKPTNPAKYGFNFIEWRLDGETYDFGKKVKTDLILTAIWESDGTTEIVTVEFDSNGGSNVTPLLISKGYTVNAPLLPTRAGYIFDGWYYDNSIFKFSTPIDNDITLVAKWKKENKISANDKEIYIPPVNNENKQTPPVTDIEQPIPTNTSPPSALELRGKCYLQNTDDIIIEFGIIPQESNKFLVNIMAYRLDVLTFEKYPNSPYNSSTGRQEYEYLQKEFNFKLTSGKLSLTKNGVTEVFVRNPKPVLKPAYKTFSLNIGSESTYFLKETLETNVDTELQWESSNTKVVKVDNKGKLYAVGLGVATVKVKTIDGLASDECVVTVTSIKVTGVTLDKTSHNAYYIWNSPVSLQATVSPWNATNSKIKWSSSNTDVVTVRSGGEVNIVNVGTAIVTATTDDGNYTAECVFNTTYRDISITSSSNFKVVEKEEKLKRIKKKRGNYICIKK